MTDGTFQQPENGVYRLLSPVVYSGIQERRLKAKWEENNKIP
jgi:hypothetical protein